MSKIYTLRKQVGYDGVSVSVATSTSKERIQLKLSGILEENKQYSEQVKDLENKVGNYYYEALSPWCTPSNGTFPIPTFQNIREYLGQMEAKYLKAKFPSLIETHTNCTGMYADPEDYGFYYTKYTRRTKKFDVDIPQEDLIRIVENRPKISDIKEPEHYSSEYDFSIEESELI